MASEKQGNESDPLLPNGNENKNKNENGKQPPSQSQTPTLTGDAFTVSSSSAVTTLPDDEDKDIPIVFQIGESFQFRLPSFRRLALLLSLIVNFIILVVKLIAYIKTFSLSVLASLLDSLLDILSQLILNYTEKHSSMHRSSALYPAGASRLEPIGVLSCAALMGMVSLEVIKESAVSLMTNQSPLADDLTMASFYNMSAIIVAKGLLLWMCRRAAYRRVEYIRPPSKSIKSSARNEKHLRRSSLHQNPRSSRAQRPSQSSLSRISARAVVQMADPTLEAIAQDHFNDILSNAVAAAALLVVLPYPHLWYMDPIGALLISVYIIYSWYETGREQIEMLTGKSAPETWIAELRTHVLHQQTNLGNDVRMQVDDLRAYHFGPKYLVEIDIILPKDIRLEESHELGVQMQFEIESRDDVERCFVHIDYQERPYEEHVVSKVPELMELYRDNEQQHSSLSIDRKDS